MAQRAQERRIDQFFFGPGARADEWRGLVDAAKAWSSGAADRSGFEEKLSRLEITEEYHAYPGRRLMAALKERAAAGDAAGTLALAMRITQALQTRSFRQHAGDWDADADADAEMPDLLPPGFGETSSRRPYFETLVVTGIPATNWSNLAAEWRKLRRSVDAFIYEPVFVGSFEDAFCAAMINPDLAAVIVNEGFAQRSRHDAPVLRSVMASMERQEMSDSALGLARTLKRIRPELDVYMVSNREVELLAGDPASQCRSPYLLLGRRTAGTASRHPRRCSGSLRDAVLRQPQEIRPAPDRNLPRSPDRARQVRIQVGLDSRHGRILRSEPVPCREQRHHRRTGQPARADRQHQESPGQGGACLRRRPCLLCHQRHIDVQQDGGAGAGWSRRHRDRRS